MPSTRKRKIEFMLTFGPHAIANATTTMVRRHGPGWLTDEQMADIVSDTCADWRDTGRRNRRNRAIITRPAPLVSAINHAGTGS